ncbi:MAG: glucosaminidase domain-containing protein, partial [Burkholderiales bacterium]
MLANPGVLASITIAQAAVESSWGESELTLKANNLFGI